LWPITKASALLPVALDGTSPNVNNPSATMVDGELLVSVAVVFLRKAGLRDVVDAL
jgi:hypothetical protein